MDVVARNIAESYPEVKAGIFLTEGLVVALAGAAVGLAIAFIGGEALRSFAPGTLPRLSSIAIDGTVLSVTLAASFLMVPLFGLAPAVQGADLKVAETLKGWSGLWQERGCCRAGSTESEPRTRSPSLV